MKRIVRRFTVAVLVASMVSQTFLGFVPRASALSTLPLQKIATQPQASVLASNGWDGAIHAIAFEGDVLIPGYGDWGSNTDSWGGASARTAVMPLDLTTNQWLTDKQFFTGTESNQLLRTINGHIYAPTTDPSIYGSGGYATNASGQWMNHFPAGLQQAIHIFDVASLNDSDQDLWAFGSMGDGAGGGKAVAWHSTDAGVTWAEAMSDVSTAPGGSTLYERMKWGAALNGKMYMQADAVNPDAPMHVFDGATETWSTLPRQSNCFRDGGFFPKVMTFDNKIVCGIQGRTLYLFDGTNTVPYAFGSASGYGSIIVDMYVDGGYFYAIDRDGEIGRTSTWSQPMQTLITAQNPSLIEATALGVHNDRIYVGDYQSNILTLPQTISEILIMKNAPVTSYADTMLITIDGSSVQMSVTGSSFMEGISATLDGVPMNVVRNSSTSLSIVIDTSKLTVQAGGAGVTTTTTSQYSIDSKYVSLVLTNPDGGSGTYTQLIKLRKIIPVVTPAPVNGSSGGTQTGSVTTTTPTTTKITTNTATKKPGQSNAPTVTSLGTTQNQPATSSDTETQTPASEYVAAPRSTASFESTYVNDTSVWSGNTLLRIFGFAAVAVGAILVFIGRFRKRVDPEKIHS